jgi:outer membrane protein assembly factor BamA
MMKAIGSCVICMSLLTVCCQRQDVAQSPSTTTPTASSAAAPVISRVIIANNNRIPTESIRAQIKAQPGQQIDEATVSADVQRLLASGKFDDVKVKDEVASNGDRVLVYYVWEKSF